MLLGLLTLTFHTELTLVSLLVNLEPIMGTTDQLLLGQWFLMNMKFNLYLLFPGMNNILH